MNALKTRPPEEGSCLFPKCSVLCWVLSWQWKQF